MNILEELKLSKKQNSDERYDYLCQQFNAVDYVIKLEKYTIKLQEENKKLNGVIQTHDILLKSNVEENKRLSKEIDMWNKKYNDMFDENKQLKELIGSLEFIKNRKNQGCSQEAINKMAIKFVNGWLKEVSDE